MGLLTCKICQAGAVFLLLLGATARGEPQNAPALEAMREAAEAAAEVEPPRAIVPGTADAAHPPSRRGGTTEQARRTAVRDAVRGEIDREARLRAGRHDQRGQAAQQDDGQHAAANAHAAAAQVQAATHGRDVSQQQEEGKGKSKGDGSGDGKDGKDGNPGKAGSPANPGKAGEAALGRAAVLGHGGVK